MALTKELLEERGFTPKKHLINGLEWWKDLGRMRHLVVIKVGQEYQEIVFLVHLPVVELGRRVDPPESICVSNYDYDRLMTVEKLDALLMAFGFVNLVKTDGL